MNYVIAIGAFQAFTAMILLWKNKLRSKADSLLILLMLCIAVHLAIKFYIYNFVNDGEVRLQMNTFIGFCYGPLLYLYALKNRDDHFIPASRWYVFLPFLLGVIGYMTVICVLLFGGTAGYTVLHFYNNSTTWVFIGSQAFFTLLAMRIARKLPAGKEQERRLVLHIGYCMLLICVLGAVFLLLGTVHDVEMNLLSRSIVYAILVLACILIIRYKYVAVMVIPPERVAPPVLVAAESVPARKMQLPAAAHQLIWEQLQAQLKETRIFTDADLNLDKLAQSVNVSKYHLSETLNSYAHKSFYQYINELRIEHAIARMHTLNEKELPVNILVLAYDCGFKAKSSFNQYFKKITGTTPTEYYRSISRLRKAPGLPG